MKRICLMLIIIMLILIIPLTAFAEGDEPSTSPSPDATITPAATATSTPTPSPSPTQQAPETPAPIADQLHIDSYHIYDGMDRTYADGYIPQIKDGKAVIVLPLVGQTYAGTVNLKADLGATTDSPFVFGNYSRV